MENRELTPSRTDTRRSADIRFHGSFDIVADGIEGEPHRLCRRFVFPAQGRKDRGHQRAWRPECPAQAARGLAA
jgi:hypothetical protein